MRFLQNSLMSLDKNKVGFIYLMVVMGVAFVALVVLLVQAYLG